jgi:hypothetical protein
MCATVSWGAHESFIHPIFVLKNGCDSRMVLHFSLKSTTLSLYLSQKINIYDINDLWFIPCNTYKCCNKLNQYVTTNHRSSHNLSLCVATLQRLLTYVTNT